MLWLILGISQLLAQDGSRGVKPLNKGSDKDKIRKAVIIGISEYQFLPPLEYAHVDAQLFADYLKTNINISEDSVFLILNSQASKETIRDKIHDLLNKALPGEQILIYFAGHGDANSDQNIVQSGYLLCHGARQNIPYEKNQALSIETLKTYISGAARKDVEVFLVVDACRAGEFAKNKNHTINKTLTELINDWKNTVKFISCQPNQYSHEGPQWGSGQGVFTYYLIEGLKQLKNSDTLGSNYILNDLFKYIEDKTTYDTNNKQIPLKTGDITRQITSYFPPKINLIDSFNLKLNDEKIPVNSKKSIGVALPPNDNSINMVSYSQLSGIEIENRKADEKEKLRVKLQLILDSLNLNGYNKIPKEVLEEGIKVAEKLLSQFTLIPDEIKELKANILLFEGYLLLKRGNPNDLKKAHNNFLNIKRQYPNSSFIHNALGHFHVLDNNFNSAIYYFEKGKELAIHWKEPYENLVDIYFKNEDYEKSFWASLDFIEHFPLDHSGYQKLRKIIVEIPPDKKSIVTEAKIKKVEKNLKEKESYNQEDYKWIETKFNDIYLALTPEAIATEFRLKKRVAVFTFDDKTDKSWRWWNNKSVGEGMSDMLTTELVKSGEFIVIERAELDQILAEQKLGLSGAVTAQSAAEVGKLLGVELAVVGAVTEYGYKDNSTGGRVKGIGIGVSNKAATVGVDCRFINTTTGEIIAADHFLKERATKGVKFNTKGLSFDSKKKFDESLVGKAARETIEEVTEMLSENIPNVEWQAKVVTAKNGAVFINVGAIHGVKPGDTFVIYQKGEELIDPDTGLSLGSMDTKIGEIKVTNVTIGNGKASQCIIVNGSQFKSGDIVRLK